jgi:hypothetical protein
MEINNLKDYFKVMNRELLLGNKGLIVFFKEKANEII